MIASERGVTSVPVESTERGDSGVNRRRDVAVGGMGSGEPRAAAAAAVVVVVAVVAAVMVVGESVSVLV